ncbi:3-hydroxyacyl-CoA dehydrogenase/enoyl-CoA hydratase family protein [Bacillus sp. B1-b2]|uniref:3-hydroxyacyl-CoA dehydrogenase/enoyl-CoA hydratase family protein n=1 Tax=Bacillus sp. B1-b2 TaxID=2653201 RepID=UPI0012626BB3|nr:3-hydroxyacyl-CoA dehydrogenase NAD-binding domain-containing protein [Bacillus sp. B1-b2]KAB7666512.1 3-hydroxyacyl-CoA dehydrogenase/enoyl-CoA hydratase family protein [Bacillus sp. B1-b2]
MSIEIKTAAVIGSGVMGSNIAALLLNAGIPTVLLDIIPTELEKEEINNNLTINDKEVRNRFVQNAVTRIKGEKPNPLTSQKHIRLLTVGNIEDNFSLISNADWIIEAITEDLGKKQVLFKKIDTLRKKGSIVSTNTSGISINEIKDGLSDDFQAHFLGTHFFNPPRYIKLLEMIPTKETKQEIVNYMTKFSQEKLGKVVVYAKDTPNFIANRIGAFAFLNLFNEMIQFDMTIEEVDSLTGKLIGRPKMATFQTLDMVGLDTFYQVVKNVHGRLKEEEEKNMYSIPPCIEEMVTKNMLGRKVKKGFYTKTNEGLMVLNYHSMKYEPVKSKKGEIAKELLSFLKEENKESRFLWKGLAPFLLYAAKMTGEVADSIYSVDSAIENGFNWNKGPFRLWDEMSLIDTVERMREESYSIPSWITEMLENGFESFYKEINGKTYYYHQNKYVPIPLLEGQISIKERKNNRDIIVSNQGASLMDIGDDVLFLELHSTNNSIGMDIIAMIEQAVEKVQKAPFKGLVIGSEKKNFSIGANLAMILVEAQNDDKTELELVVRRFQDAMYKIKYCEKPIVAAPFQRTLGGGAEICLAATKVQALMETYIGLVETGVGLIPGGGGTKELYLNLLMQKEEYTDKELLQLTGEVFERILTASVSTSADYGKELGYLNQEDGITFNEVFLLRDAKRAVIELFNNNYQPPTSSKILVSGKTGFEVIMKKVELLKQVGGISEYEAFIARELAFVLTGGDVGFRTLVEEQYLLDLERNAFITLLSQEETQKRMLYLLQTGKPYPSKK